jgi:crotonobetainyl-CoA:carnitine CoA-transferase CaiB-like acyl-CoA transferase
MFHQGVYPVSGEDRWIAITCRSREEWLKLVELAGVPDTEPASRDEVLARWTRGQEGAPLAAQLQRAGIAAGVVQDIEDLLEHDPQIKHRGTLMQLEHPHLGAFGHVRTPISFSRSHTSPYRPPAIGEHSLAIVRDIAGLTPERIEQLQAAGVFE